VSSDLPPRIRRGRKNQAPAAGTAAKTPDEIIPHQQAERALRELPAKYADWAEEQSFLLENICGFVYRRDTKGIFYHVSPAVEQITGYTAAEWCEHYSTYLTDNPVNKHVRKATQKALKTGVKMPPFTAEIYHKNGSRVTLEVNERPFFLDHKVAGIIGIARDVTERLRAERTLKQLVLFEKLITSISTSFINLPSEEIPQGINRALREIGEFAGVDRSYIFLLSEDKTLLHNTHEWCAPGIKPEIDHMQGLARQSIPWFAERILKPEIVYVPRVKDLPEEAKTEKAILQRQNVQSFICVPMMLAGPAIGFVGFDSVRCEKTWPREIISLLTIVSKIFSDALARKQTEEALRKSEERFRDVFENSLVGIYQTTPDGRILMANPALVRMLGYSCFADLAQRNLEEEGFEPEYPRIQFKRQLEQRGQAILEAAWVRRDGSTLFVRECAKVIRDNNGNILYYLGTVEDITERRQAQKKIEAYQQQLRSLASQLSLTEERQRRRLATDLHDHIGQLLAVSQIKLGSLREIAMQAGWSKRLDEVRDLLEQTIQYTRSLTFELSPPVLYELGLEAAIEWLLENTCKQHGISYELDSDDKPKPLDEDVQALLFQAVRELLVNVAKHARARKVKSSIRKKNCNIQITIEDDGIGLDPAQLDLSPQSISGFGLFNIRERLDHLGGQFKLDSRAGQGTRIILTAPLKKSPNSSSR